ncbi:MAG TPA: hypothetical protein PLG42_03890 [Bacteroidales bacterium]|nr:hypothetical protein [Bacteroidales bacterium]
MRTLSIASSARESLVASLRSTMPALFTPGGRVTGAGSITLR